MLTLRCTFTVVAAMSLCALGCTEARTDLREMSVLAHPAGNIAHLIGQVGSIRAAASPLVGLHADSRIAVPVDPAGDAQPMGGGNPGCPECLYDVSTKHLTGTLDPDYDDHPYPFHNMTIKLYNSTTLLYTEGGLPPDPGYGNDDIDTYISTTETSVTGATLTWRADDNETVTQNITVQ